MTIVAYKNKTLAADTAVWTGNVYSGDSKKIIKTYRGYAKGQLNRITSKTDRSTKPLMHLIRLMLTGSIQIKQEIIGCYPN